MYLWCNHVVRVAISDTPCSYTQTKQTNNQTSGLSRNTEHARTERGEGGSLTKEGLYSGLGEVYY